MSLGSKILIFFAVSLQQFPIKFCITTMHMNYSLFVLHLICHIRQNISFAVSLQQFPTKFCITTMHMNYSLFVLHLIYSISDRTIALLILYDNSLQNFASPQSIWIFHSSLFVFHLHMYSIYNKKISCGFITMTESTRYLF